MILRSVGNLYCWPCTQDKVQTSDRTFTVLGDLSCACFFFQTHLLLSIWNLHFDSKPLATGPCSMLALYVLFPCHTTAPPGRPFTTTRLSLTLAQPLQGDWRAWA